MCLQLLVEGERVIYTHIFLLTLLFQIERLLQPKDDHKGTTPHPHPLLPEATPTGSDLPVHHLYQTTPTGSNGMPVHPLLAKRKEPRVQLPSAPDLEESPPSGNGWRKPASGLSSLAERYLGKPLDKSQQLSNWERRPLREEQIKYAGV